MPSVTTLFSFATNDQSFVATPASAFHALTWASTIGSPAGSLQATVTGKFRGKAPSFREWTGTWEALGVPAGATVTAIRLNSTKTQLRQYTTGVASDIGPYELRDSGSVLLATLWAGRLNLAAVDTAFISTGAQADQAVPEAQQPSGTTIKLRLANSLGTGNSTTAVVTSHDDEVAFAVTYFVPDAVAPTAPTGMAVKDATNPVPNWDHNTEADLAKYKLYRSDISGSGFALLADNLVPNMLSENQSSFETDVTTFMGASNCTIARSTAVSLHGGASMSVSLSAAQETLDAYVVLANFSLAPSTQYTWFAWVYCETSFTLARGGIYLQENGGPGPYRNIANAGTFTTLPAGWNLIGGTGTTPADWFGLTRLILRPARRSDSTGFDSTKILYYDKIMVAKAQSSPEWMLGGRPNYTDTTTVPGTNHFWKVTALDTSGNESDFSTEASIPTAAVAKILSTLIWAEYAVAKATPAVPWAEYATGKVDPALTWGEYALANLAPILPWSEYGTGKLDHALTWSEYDTAKVSPQLPWDEYTMGKVAPILIWDELALAALAAHTATLLWGEHGLAARSATLPWNEHALAARPIQLVYDERSLTGLSPQMTWAEYGLGANGPALLWNEAGLSKTDRQLLWSEAALAALDSHFNWDEAGLTTADRTVLWQESGHARSDRSLLWSEAGLSAAERSLLWSEAALAATNPSLSWAEASLANATPVLLWDELSLAALTQATAMLLWNEHGLAAAPRSLQWQEYAKATSSRSLLWAEYALARRTHDGLWDEYSTSAPIGPTLTWDERGLLTTSSTLLWSESALARAHDTLLWAEAGLARLEPTILWSEAALVQARQTLTLAWAEYSAASTLLTLLFHEHALTTTTADLAWQERTLTRAELLLFWTEYDAIRAARPDLTALADSPGTTNVAARSQRTYNADRPSSS